MNTNAEELKKQYSVVSSMITELLTKIKGESNDINIEDITAQKSDTISALSGFEKKINEDIKSLVEKDAEWDTFTIAFYGETNAGKSSIIETLRILLNESSKENQHREFDKIASSINYKPGCLENYDAEFKEIEHKVSENINKIEMLHSEHENNLSKLNGTTHHLETSLANEKLQYSFWEKIKYIFIKSDTERTLKSHLATIQSTQVEYLNKVKLIESINQTLLSDKQELQASFDVLKENLEKLRPFVYDGEIIGNGQRDFTTKTEKYNFESNGQKFAILDMPGIEGEESKVKEDIDQALKKAHAVFYVTPKAKTPEKGNDGSPGTIDKIKAHLESQTEVYTIFNKKITNPIVLRGELTNSDECSSLDNLDAEMKKILGDNYQSPCMRLSAIPAFLASTTRLLPVESGNVDFYSSQQKFLKDLSREEIFIKSGFKDFTNYITDEICQNYEKKIILSNTNKLKNIITGGIECLDIAYREYKKTESNVRKIYKNTSTEIDELVNNVEPNLESKTRELTKEMISSIRGRLYDQIKKNISNDEVKSLIEDESKALGETFEPKIKRIFDEVTNEFAENMKDVIQRFVKHSEGMFNRGIQNNPDLSNLSIKIDFKFDNGINVLGLLGGLGGVGWAIWAAIIGGGGWTFLSIASLVAGLVAVGKSVMSFFSDGYKMSQQRDKVDEFLAKARKQIEQELKDSFDEMKKEYQKIGTDTQKKLGQIPENIQQLCEQFVSAKQGLATLVNEI